MQYSKDSGSISVRIINFNKNLVLLETDLPSKRSETLALEP